MAKKLAIVLPVYNEEGNIQRAFSQLSEGIKSIQPKFTSSLFLWEDGSFDKTLEEIVFYGLAYRLPITFHTNNINRGLALCLREAFDEAIYHQNHYILKTDVDGNYNLVEVVQKLTKAASRGADAAIGIKEFKHNESTYETERRVDLARILKEEFDITDLYPAYCGSQLYRAETLKNILEYPIARDFRHRWGFDFLIAMLARTQANPLNIETLSLVEGFCQPDRRDKEKVKLQYDTYISIVSDLTRKEPTQLSKIYGI